MLRISSAVVVVFYVAGCSKGPYDIAPVSGVVTLNGKPVAKVVLAFQPDAPKGTLNPGPGAYGVTDANGRYTMKMVGSDQSGVVVGKHQVRLGNLGEADQSEDAPKSRPKPANPIPNRYYGQAKAPFEFEVKPGGTDKADFALTSP